MKRKVVIGLTSLVLVGGAAPVLPGTAVGAALPVPQAARAETGPGPDELTSPLQKKAQELRETAVSQVLKGKVQVESGSSVRCTE